MVSDEGKGKKPEENLTKEEKEELKLEAARTIIARRDRCVLGRIGSWFKNNYITAAAIVVAFGAGVGANTLVREYTVLSMSELARYNSMKQELTKPKEPENLTKPKEPEYLTKPKEPENLTKPKEPEYKPKTFDLQGTTLTFRLEDKALELIENYTSLKILSGDSNFSKDSGLAKLYFLIDENSDGLIRLEEANQYIQHRRESLVKKFETDLEKELTKAE